MLSGVDITSWGSDLPGAPKLGHLVRKILKLVPDLPRLRLSSIDPAELDADLMTALADEPRLMPHLHLSVQHGDDLILKRMKRRHLARDVVRFVKKPGVSGQISSLALISSRAFQPKMRPRIKTRWH